LGSRAARVLQSRLIGIVRRLRLAAAFCTDTDMGPSPHRAWSAASQKWGCTGFVVVHIIRNERDSNRVPKLLVQVALGRLPVDAATIRRRVFRGLGRADPGQAGALPLGSNVWVLPPGVGVP
jgi:hypothetical protein